MDSKADVPSGPGMDWHENIVQTDTNEMRLRFTHAGWKAETDYCFPFTKVWEELMVRLKTAVEGEGIDPRFFKDGLAS
jgi:hypothetical protein